MLKLVSIVALVFLMACQPKSEPAQKVQLNKSSTNSMSSTSEDDFSDFEKKDESCGDKKAEDILKKSEMKKEVSLQGSSEEDCSVQ